MLSFLQTALLPLSAQIPILSNLTRGNHHLLVIAHLVLFILAYNSMKQRSASMAEVIRWAIPEIVTGAVEMQRRGEVDAEKRLRGLERLKYVNKGP